MKISVFGCELSGLVTAGALAKEGNHVLLVSMETPVGQCAGGTSLTGGEPGLGRLLNLQILEQRLVYVSDWDEAISHADVIIISTPPWLKNLVEDLVARIGNIAKKDILVINQSTFSVGKANEFEEVIKQLFQQREVGFLVDVLAMPELVIKGSAVDGFLNSEQIILGGDNPQALKKVTGLFLPFCMDKDNLNLMSTRAAEYTKFALNSILATRISLINELANGAELLGVDFAEVREGIGFDKRIGFNYINPGCGFGGPSFTADMDSLINTFKEKGIDSNLLSAAISENEIQKEVLFRKAWRLFDNDLEGKKFAVWGLSFKPDTASVVNAPSLSLVKSLIAQGATVVGYDPIAKENFRSFFTDEKALNLVDDKYEALAGVDALFLLTEWQEFIEIDLDKLKAQMQSPIIFDGRNLYDPKNMAENEIKYIGIGGGIVV